MNNEKAEIHTRPMRDSAHHDEIDLLGPLGALWKRRYMLAVVSIICGVLACASSYLFKRKYQTAVEFVTVTDDAMGGRAGGLAALASQLGGLASLGGLTLSGNERKAEYLATLQSQSLIERFIAQNNLIPVLYADAWDETRKTWKDADTKNHPTTWKAIQRFKSNVMRLSTANKTGISTLSITWSDARVGAIWANELVELADEYVRARTIAETERNIVYLNDQLTKTSVVAVQNSISTLLEDQIKRMMLAKGTDQYAFRVIDPALPPERASFPKRIVWGILGSFIGLAGSIAFVCVGWARVYWKHPEQRE
jgi:uncharacterized protein involved in exopolysaccharide biosynthesis